MKIKINHQESEILVGASLADVVHPYVKGNLRGVAVAINQKVIPAKAFADTYLQEGDSILIIKATQGG